MTGENDRVDVCFRSAVFDFHSPLTKILLAQYCSEKGGYENDLSHRFLLALLCVVHLLSINVLSLSLLMDLTISKSNHFHTGGKTQPVRESFVKEEKKE